MMPRPLEAFAGQELYRESEQLPLRDGTDGPMEGRTTKFSTLNVPFPSEERGYKAIPYKAIPLSNESITVRA